MKKILLCLLLVLAVGFASCKSGKDNDQGGSDKEPAATVDLDLDASLKDVCKDSKIYLTTCGQSDIETVYSVLLACDIDEKNITKDNLLGVSDVEAGGVVFLVVGTSSKGLGSAGTNVADETARAKAFSDAAKAGTFKVVVLHVGGEGRRGTQSDPVIKAALAGAKVFLVKDDGKVDSDGVITASAKEANVPLYFYSGAGKMAKPIKTLLGL